VFEGGHFYLHRMKEDGTQAEKISSEPIIGPPSSISPDERFVVVRTIKRGDNLGVEALPIAGGPTVPLCSGLCNVDWTQDGKAMYFYWIPTKGSSNDRTYVVPLIRGTDFPKLPSAGFQSEAELRTDAVQMIEGAASSGPNSSLYSFTKPILHSNLYRIPLQ